MIYTIIFIITIFDTFWDNQYIKEENSAKICFTSYSAYFFASGPGVENENSCANRSLQGFLAAKQYSFSKRAHGTYIRW